MTNEERKHRVALTLLVSAFVFCIIFIAVALSGIIVYFLFEAELISTTDGMPDPLYTLVFMGSISLVIGACLTAFITKFSLRPINRLVNQMNRLASGDFKARIAFGSPISSHPTFIEVANSFNKMAQELENTEMLRGDFINNFSHEFKTPIVSIAGFAKLLKRGNLSDQEKCEYIDIIEEESLRLSAMATNVLNLTKYENQTILTDISTFNLSEQLRSAILALEGKWVKKNVDFNLDLGEYLIVGNKDMLKHVWINLIDNAIKFSLENSTIDINVQDAESHYMVSIINYGSEITEEQKKRIFNKFYQGDESHASEGNGIGLAIVKGVVDLHHGNVEVQSKNKCTIFEIKLPKEQ